MSVKFSEGRIGASVSPGRGFPLLGTLFSGAKWRVNVWICERRRSHGERVQHSQTLEPARLPAAACLCGNTARSVMARRWHLRVRAESESPCRHLGRPRHAGDRDSPAAQTRSSDPSDDCVICERRGLAGCWRWLASDPANIQTMRSTPLMMLRCFCFLQKIYFDGSLRR